MENKFYKKDHNHQIKCKLKLLKLRLMTLWKIS